MEAHIKIWFAGLARLLSGFIAMVLSASAIALVPQPAADQSEPIAIVGAIIHIGNGEVIADGVITFSEGIITAVAAADDAIDLSNHRVIDLQGTHVYPGFVLPNTSLGLTEVGASRATADFEEEGDINASVRSAIAYNTDSEIISTHRFNGILTAQVTPQGGLVSGSSSLMKLDGWNWEDASHHRCAVLHLPNSSHPASSARKNPIPIHPAVSPGQ
jgi:hypothetical protein